MENNKKEKIEPFYVKYTPDFTEDLFNAAIKWIDNNKPDGCRLRSVVDDYSYEKFKIFEYLLFNGNYLFLAHNEILYGIDNNRQDIKTEIDIIDLKRIIGYKEEKTNIEKYIVGKWYKTVSNNFFGKYLKSDEDDNFWSSERSITHVLDYTRSDFNFGKTFKWIVATQEEINKFLPDGHPDKTTNRVKVFESIYVGDIVVSLDNTSAPDRYTGDIFKVLEESKPSFLYYKYNRCNSSKESWRLATAEEIELFNKGVRNINDVFDNKIQTESNSMLDEAKKRYPVGSKIIPAHTNQDKEFIIITENSVFEIDKEGDIISRVNGDNWKPSSEIKYGNTTYNRIVYDKSQNKWSDFYQKEVEDKPKEMTKEELLAEANRRYPVGTIVRCDLGSFENRIFTRKNELYTSIHGNISAFGEPFIYLNGQWAEIIDYPNLVNDVSTLLTTSKNDFPTQVNKEKVNNKTINNSDLEYQTPVIMSQKKKTKNKLFIIVNN